MGSGPMAKFVLFVLLGFSVTSWAIMAERWRAFGRAQRESDAFLERFKKGGGLAAIQDATATLVASPLAHLFRAAFREISLNPPPPEGADPETVVGSRPRAAQERARSRSPSSSGASAFSRPRPAPRRSSGCSARSGES